MKQQCFKSGDVFPALEPGKLRLYSMRLCPYAQRTRLVLAFKNIPHETVNINLKEKPDWFLERAPLGLVPVLEQDGKIVYESSICDEYLDASYPGPSLLPTDPYLRARQAITMERFSKAVAAFYKVRRAQKGSEEDKASALDELVKALPAIHEALNDKFFGGDKPQMIDLHFWPFFEKWQNFGKVLDEFPKFKSWMSEMMKLPAVKATYNPPETHAAFWASSNAGAPNYDIGL